VSGRYSTQSKASFREKWLKNGQKLMETQGKIFARPCLNPIGISLRAHPNIPLIINALYPDLYTKISHLLYFLFWGVLVLQVPYSP